MGLPSADEQWLFELANRIRVDPGNELSRLFSSLDPLTAIDPQVHSAVRFFGVDTNALQANFAGLSKVSPLAWNSGIADAATAHNNLMIAQNIQSHNLPGEAGIFDRIQAATVERLTRVSENIFLYGEGIEYSHAAYVVDWGSTPTGIQQPAGHLLAMTNGAFNLGGFAVGTSQVGDVATTQNFGQSSEVGPFVLGVAFDDNDGDAFYDAGEGLAGITVSINGQTTATWASGGYQIDMATTGPVTVTFSGGILNGEISTTIDIGSGNRKVDLALLGPEGTPTIMVRDDGVFGDNNTEASTATNTDPIPPATLGTDGADELRLGEADDHVRAGGGNDGIWGGGGHDLIYGNAGSDLVYGNAGQDTVFGGKDHDSIFGGKDGDAVYGNLGNDAVYGNLGNDQIYGGADDDLLFGGQGDDWLFGNKGNDQLFGNVGNDTLNGGSGDDQLFGAAGADVFVVSPGFDTAVDFNGLSGDRVQVTGSGWTLQGDSGGVTIFAGSGNALRINGVSFNDFDTGWII